MVTPGEHKTVQARILAYAQEIGWTFVPRAEAESRRGFDAGGASAEQAPRAHRCSSTSCCIDRVKTFNP